MNKQRISLAVGVALMVLLSACAHRGAGAETAPPPPPEAIEPHPVMTDTPTPAPAGKVDAGEILFVANGKLMAIRADGSNGRAVYTPPQGAQLHDLAVSPDGHYLAFANAAQLMVLDLEQGQVNKIAESATDRFSSPVWTLASDALYYHQMVIGSDSRPVRSLVMRADMPPASADPVKVLDFDLSSNMPILPTAAWRGGILFLHQSDLTGGSLGQWIMFEPQPESLAPLAQGYGLWDVSPDRTRMLLYSTADLAGGAASPSAPIYSASLDLLKGAVSLNKLTPDDLTFHLEAARYGADGLHIAALQVVGTGDGGFRRQVVLLAPGTGGKDIVARLAPDDAVDDIALVWGGSGLIVQRMRGGQPELWEIPLDGSAGTLLAQGEQPVVDPAH